MALAVALAVGRPMLSKLAIAEDRCYRYPFCSSSWDEQAKLAWVSLMSGGRQGPRGREVLL